MTVSPVYNTVTTNTERTHLNAVLLSFVDGWIYTNDSWLDPHSAPVEEWKVAGSTRRRRWVRRIFRDPDTSS